METIHLTYPHTLNKKDLRETVCAIGFFDGLHKGHLKVINQAVSIAKQKNLESAVITFHPHPRVVLSDESHGVKYITSLKEKQRILSELSIDRLYVITFNKELSLLSPEKFVDHFLVQLNMKHVVGGFDYSYGYKGEGTMEQMESLAKGQLTTTIVPKVEYNDEKISSTHIRHLLSKGSVEYVQELLGRPLRTDGIVVHGEKRGRTIGFPTANVSIEEDCVAPTVGVYAVKVIHEHQMYYGMANVGYKPTFIDDQEQATIEVHIFDFNKDIYDDQLSIQWYAFIRDEKKFSGVDSLITQIKQDEQAIKEFFKKKNI